MYWLDPGFLRPARGARACDCPITVHKWDSRTPRTGQIVVNKQRTATGDFLDGLREVRIPFVWRQRAQLHPRQSETIGQPNRLVRIGKSRSFNPTGSDEPKFGAINKIKHIRAL